MDTTVTDKKKVNVVVIGEVGAGKSSLVGNLMYEFCNVSNKISLGDLEKEAEELNDSKYALFLSKLNAFPCIFQTDLCEVNILNGYYKGCSFMSQFLRNTYRADCAVLVISANADDFEKGIHEKGQTCRQILLAFHLGVPQLIVVVNKMDCTVPSYSETRFQEIKNKMSIFINKIGYNPVTVSFLPISALYGDNVVKISTKMPWFNSWIMKQRNGNSSECLGAFKLKGYKKCYAGRIIAGVLKPGMQIVSSLTRFSTKVECIRIKAELVTEVSSPENFTMELENVTMPYYVGDVLGEVGNCPPTLVSYFVAQDKLLKNILR